MSEPIFFEMEDGTTYCSMAEYERLRDALREIVRTHQQADCITDESIIMALTARRALEADDE